jgi:hypothetical protein
VLDHAGRRPDDAEALLAVDTKSFEVTSPSSAAPADDDDPPWLWIGVLGGILGIGFASVISGKRETTEEKTSEHA